MQYRQDSIIRVPITWVELITILIVTIRTYLAQVCGRFFCVLENFRCKFANFVAPSTYRTTKRLVRCKAHPGLYRQRKQSPSPCIIGDAILPQTGKKLTQKCRPEFDGLLWHHLKPQKKSQYGSTTTIHHVHKGPK